MREKPATRSYLDRLRREAERILEREPALPAPTTLEDTAKLAHELQLRELELQLQNEDLRTAQVDLEVARSRYFELYDTAPVGYLTLSPQGKIREVNPTATDLLGATRQVLLGLGFAGFVIGTHVERLRDHLRDALDSAAACSCELQLSTAGAGRWVQLRSSAVSVSGDRPVEVRTTMTDITGRIAAERALSKANDDFERLVADRDAGMHVQGKAQKLLAGAQIRLLLADDHPMLREGLAERLSAEADLAVVGQASDGAEAVALARELRPDVIIMDVAMPRLDGVEATRVIARDQPGVKVIALSMHERREMSQAMIGAGAAVYLSKNGPYDELLSAIRVVRAGNGRPAAQA
jgi:PAS domain S-box-containing protein